MLPHLLSIHLHYTNNTNPYTDSSKFKAIDKRGGGRICKEAEGKGGGGGGNWWDM